MEPLDSQLDECNVLPKHVHLHLAQDIPRMDFGAPRVDTFLSALADFGNVTFTECSATVGGVTFAIDNFSVGVVLMCSQSGGVQLANVSPTRNSEKKFAVASIYGV